MKKLLIVYNYILHYRKPLFNELSKYFEVVILHSGNKTVNINDSYAEVIFPVKKIGPFFLQSGVIQEVKKDEYDVIISLFDVRWVNSLLSIYLYNKKCKFIWWGAWITNSYIANIIRIQLIKLSDSNIFYTNEARNDFILKGSSSENLYVANNTFDVGYRIKCYKNPIKNKIIFVGSLDERKQVDILIKVFSKIIKEIPIKINLIIIGDGECRGYLEKLVKEMELNNRAKFKGKITDADELKSYYREAIVSVSYGQAGLSVLQALGFGVPFLTKINAISGGEKSNIKHNINSIFCEDSMDSLESYLMKLCNNIDFSRDLGKNAYQYYTDYCTIENMAQGFIDAINNTSLSNIDTNNISGKINE